MEDTEMLDQDLQNGSGASLADASLEQKETAKQTENQKSGEKESEDDKSVTLPSDLLLMDNQVVSDDPDNTKVTSVGESLSAKDDDQMMENKNNEDGTHEADVAPDLIDNQVLSNETDNSKVTSVHGNLSAKDDEQMTENESNEHGTHIENNHEADESRDSIDNQVSSKEPATTDGNPSANNDDQMMENKSNGDDDTHVENNHETDVSGDIKLTDNQVLSKETDNNKATDLNANNGDQMAENKSNGDDTHVENNHDSDAASDPLPISVILPPKVKHENVRKFNNWLNEAEPGEAGDTGTPEEVAAFMKELETFHRVNALDYKPPKFYGEPLNCLKLWRAVIRLGGYELVTASKLWRQVGESFHPPKTCTTVSWTFRIFYEKALLEFEKHMRQNGELPAPSTLFTPVGSVEKDTSGHQGSGSGRQRRDAASRAMQGWHTQRNLGNGEVGEPIIKDKNANSSGRREKHLKSIGLPKHKTPSNVDFMDISAGMQAHKQLIPEVVDIGPPADWVKINVRECKDCYEVYALVPGLLREEVRVQSDPVGRLVITGQPEQVVNPWGITPFKKVVNLPGRIDPLRTSALVSLHGRLFVRVPFEREST